MIVAVEGVLEVAGPDFAVVNVGGISLRAAVPASTVAALPGPGQRVKLLTHLHLREDVLALFGFGTREEVQLFELLLGVRDVGPRLALAMLSAMAADALRARIAAGDVAALTQIRGVGRRTAERLALELKDKVGIAAEPPALAPGDAELLAALIDLGMRPAEAQEAVRAVPAGPGVSTEERLRQVLMSLDRR